MRQREQLTQAELKAALRYDPDTPGCPSWGEEKRAGAGNGCLAEQHHYVEAECAS